MPTKRELLIERREETERELAQARKQGLQKAIAHLRKELDEIERELKKLGN